MLCCFIVVLPGPSMELFFKLLTWKIYPFNCIVVFSSEIDGLLAAYEELVLLWSTCIYLKMLVRTFRCLDSIPRLGKRELTCLLLCTSNYVILFGEVFSFSGYLGWAALFYCGTPWAFALSQF